MIRAGILGLGYMGSVHVQKIKSVDGISVCCAHDIDTGKKDTAEAEGLQFFDDRAAFLAQPDLDLVVIATPNQFHRDYAIEAMQAHKHVVCEKPVALNTAQLDTMIQAAEKNDRLFTVHQNRRWDTDYRLLRQVIEDGTLGKAISIESRVLGERGIVFGWRADPAYGGGMLYDWGVHQVDQLLQLFPRRKVTRVFAQLWSVNTLQVDDYFKLALVFDDQTSAHVECGVFALEKLPRWFVYGDTGTLKINDFSAQSGQLSKINHRFTVEVSEGIDPVVGSSRTMAPLRPEQIHHVPLPNPPDASSDFYQNIVDAFNDIRKLAVTPASVRRTMQVIDAAFQSSQTRQSIDVLI
jgi:scyllo-inositol 2-dehydrogenase (NADP+)